MPWLSVLSGILKLGSVIASICKDKGLMDAGAAKSIAKSNDHAIKNIERAMAARRAVKHGDDDIMRDPDRRK